MYYNSLSGYLKEKYGKRLKKICIDGGFTCPNRDGKCGTGGCIFCGERGSGEHIDALLSIEEQVLRGLSSGKEDDKFIAYFQNFTNTYADVSTLRKRYDAALTDDRIVALAIGTRADCIDEEVCKLIAEYKKRLDVWVELGLQTINDETAKLINRGYNTEVFTNACKTLKKYSIETVAHLMVGLPGENMEDAIKTAEYIANLGCEGIKIHSVYVMEGTVLANMYRKKAYTPPTLDEYAETVAKIISLLPGDMIIHRITGDCPRDMLVAPEWNRDKNAIISAINQKLSLYKKDKL